jgi:iron complex transport system ATP-binding protein
VVAAGPIDDVLTEANLAETFGMPLVLTHEAGRWAARRASEAPVDSPLGG